MAKKKAKTDICVPSQAEQDRWRAESDACAIKAVASLSPAQKKQAMAKLREDEKAIQKALRMK